MWKLAKSGILSYPLAWWILVMFWYWRASLNLFALIFLIKDSSYHNHDLRNIFITKNFQFKRMKNSNKEILKEDMLLKKGFWGNPKELVFLTSFLPFPKYRSTIFALKLGELSSKTTYFKNSVWSDMHLLEVEWLHPMDLQNNQPQNHRTQINSLEVIS